MAKHHKNKKSSFPWGFLLLIIIVTASILIYSYRTNQNFKAQVNEVLGSSQQNPLEQSDFSKDTTTLEQNFSNQGNLQPQSTPCPTQTANDSTQKLVTFFKGLEKPICKGSQNQQDHQIRNFTHYSICYRETYEQAEWSAYCLTKENLVKNVSRSNDFRIDPQILTDSATLSDYKKSGYDRGHLSPAADFSFDQNAMSETFYMSNMSPQKGSFNRGIWKYLESQVRFWADFFGRVYVVSGPILEKDASQYKSIGENAVCVPEFYYKVILAPLYKDQNDRETPLDAQSAIAFGFIFPNTKCEGLLFDYATTVDEIEKRTDLDFFSLLDDEIEEKLESQIVKDLPMRQFKN